MNDLIERLEDMVDDYTVIKEDREAVILAITALRELKREQTAWRKFTKEAENTLDKADARIEELEASNKGLKHNASVIVDLLSVIDETECSKETFDKVYLALEFAET
jgi:cell division protein ZapA (FtsZ GTPase activity inhibitor)